MTSQPQPSNHKTHYQSTPYSPRYRQRRKTNLRNRVWREEHNWTVGIMRRCLKS